MRTRLYNQALAHRFGVELIGLIDSGEWEDLQFAVAWVRRSGMRRLIPSMRDLLARGGQIKGTVGVDIENTSQEGLEDLLALTTQGDACFWVYHDENPRTVFHPKIYLLRSDTDATLIIGSNNLTEAGLYTNTEAGLNIEARRTEPVVREADSMLTAWRNESSPVIKRLTPELLQQLLNSGYVLSESTLRARRSASTAAKQATQRTPLFGRLPVSVPSLPPRGGAAPQGGTTPGAVLLMRVRRASETARRTQIQIPIRVKRLPFFAGVAGLTSLSTGSTHIMGVARARGGDNTVKVEVPEIHAFADPVMKLEKDGTRILYSTFDSTSPEGIQIMNALRAGLGASVNPTSLTVPSKPESSTWWRFV